MKTSLTLLALLVLFAPRPSAWALNRTPLHLTVWDKPEWHDSVKVQAGHDVEVDGLSLCLGTGQAARLRGVGLGSLGTSYPEQMYGLQVAGLGCVAGSLRGVQVAGLGNVATQRGVGVQISGLGNVNNGGFTGLQVSGLANVTDGKGAGAQVSFLANVTDGKYVGAQASTLANVCDGGLTGVQAGGLVDVVDGRVCGVQAAGLVSVCDGGLHGLQVGGLISVSDGPSVGLQTAGLIGVADGRFNGIQAGGLATVAGDEIRGLQVALVNVAEKVKGVQAGVVNVAGDMKGLPLGAVSLVPDGQLWREAWLDESGFAAVGYRSGSRRIYNLVYAGFRPGSRFRWSLGWGAGVRTFLPGGSNLETGVELSHLNEGEFWTGGTNLLGRTKVLWVHPLTERVSLAVGPSLNWFWSGVSDGSAVAPWSVYDARHGQRWQRLWPGLSLGLRFRDIYSVGGQKHD